MDNTLLLDPVRILRGIGQSVEQGAVLIEQGVLTAFDGDARRKAKALGLTPTEAPDQLVAPCLVDPHSVLDTPFSGDQETIESLRRCAAAAGYGQVALLPRGRTWRDQPECLQGFCKDPKNGVQLHLWGGFSQGGTSERLAPHGDLLEHGAIGLADDDALISPQLLEQGLVLGEMGSCPVLVAPRDPALQGAGMVREGGRDAAGWMAPRPDQQRDPSHQPTAGVASTPPRSTTTPDEPVHGGSGGAARGLWKQSTLKQRQLVASPCGSQWLGSRRSRLEDSPLPRRCRRPRTADRCRALSNHHSHFSSRGVPR